MTPSDLDVLTTYLHGLYGERFPGLTPGMATLWLDELRPHAYALVTRAAQRWARQHTIKAPSLDELAEAVEWLADEDRRARLSTPNATPRSVLAEGQARAEGASPEWSTADKVFGRLMIQLLDYATSHARAWRNADAAEQCRQWAAYYGAQSAPLAQSLLAQAVTYDRLAQHDPPCAASLAPTAMFPTLVATPAVAPQDDEGCIHEHVDSNNVCQECGEILPALEETS
jgi:hypothetical protein